jgi:hypothetical protein
MNSHFSDDIVLFNSEIWSDKCFLMGFCPCVNVIGYTVTPL